MIHGQGVKAAIVLKPTAVATNANSTGYVDTLGYEYCIIDVCEESGAAASNNPEVLNLTECATTVSSSFATVSGFVGGTDFTIPNISTSVPTVVTRFAVDCRYRKRYLGIQVKNTQETNTYWAMAYLSRGKELPVSTTEMGVSTAVIG